MENFYEPNILSAELLTNLFATKLDLSSYIYGIDMNLFYQDSDLTEKDIPFKYKDINADIKKQIVDILNKIKNYYKDVVEEEN